MTGIERLRGVAGFWRENKLDDIVEQIERENEKLNDALEEENERLRDMLNDVAWALGLGDSVHYYSDDDYQACQKDVLAAIGSRLMPDGMSWPVFEDGEPVRIGDEVETESGQARKVRCIKLMGSTFCLCDMLGVSFYQSCYRNSVKRPTPKVLDADGEEIRVGDTVWPKYPSANRNTQVKHVEVVGIQAKYGRVDVRTVYATGLSFLEQVDADRLTHCAPVPAADGNPLREGETVYDKDTGDRFEVDGFSDGYVMCTDIDACESDIEILPSQLTHERPDSLDRLAEDIGAMVVAWRSNKDLFDAQWAAAGCVGENTLGAALDSLVRRVKRLAGDA